MVLRERLGEPTGEVGESTEEGGRLSGRSSVVPLPCSILYCVKNA